MKFVGMIGSAIAAAMLLLAQPAAAKCGDRGECSNRSAGVAAKHAEGKKSQLSKSQRGSRKATKARRSTSKAIKSKKVASKRQKSRKISRRKVKRVSFTYKIRTKRRSAQRALAVAKDIAPDHGASQKHGSVIAMISGMAPGYGVPSWFALRIAKVESGYNPSLRGKAGEYGVFQIKCPTARGLGFTGPCSQLSDAGTNVKWGLAHLSAAMKLSGGNLRLAASKHNGGLGRKSMIYGYVAKVF